MSSDQINPSKEGNSLKLAIDLFLISFISLYYELLIIRWLSSEIRIFAFFKNLPLMACLFGLGLGMSLSNSQRNWRKWFPWGFLLLTLLIFLAEPLNFVHMTFLDPLEYYLIGSITKNTYLATTSRMDRFIALLPALAMLLGVFYLIVSTFVGLGQKLADYFEKFPPLTAYSINVGASILGIVVFSTLSFFFAPPAVWVTLGALICLRFYRKLELVPLICTVAIAFVFDSRGGMWSPYYRVDVQPVVLAADKEHPAQLYGSNINVNHEGIESASNNSKEFLAKLSPQQLKGTQDYYDMLYEVLGKEPKSALILAAGAGNDAAGALRHGVKEIDCVEIDPKIAAIGKAIHPEKPYDNPGVHMHLDDARAFLRKANRQYDIVIYAYLDSHTALSSMSSLRLDNYVYTKESFQDAARLVKPGGNMAVTFYAVTYWQLMRIYKTMSEALGVQPFGVWSKNGCAVTFFVGPTLDKKQLEAQGFKIFSLKEAEMGLQSEDLSYDKVETTSDDWPFLFLRQRGLNITYSAGLLLCLLAGYRWIASTLVTAKETYGKTMFCLGAAFMLVETKSIAQISLLLGATWITNAVVIAGILIMILLANLLVSVWKPKNLSILYLITIALLVGTYFVPISAFTGMPYLTKLFAGAGLFCLPLFFAALIFASTFGKVASPATALGLNLLGALVGGVLEYLSLLTGIAALNLLAAGMYSMAALFWYKASRSGASIEKPAQAFQPGT